MYNLILDLFAIPELKFCSHKATIINSWKKKIREQAMPKIFSPNMGKSLS